MAKRSKWSVQKTVLVPKAIRDSEFAEILADIGRLIYDELSSQPDLKKSIDPISSQPVRVESASQNRKKVVNE